jgi:hypothetical protein
MYLPFSGDQRKFGPKSGQKSESAHAPAAAAARARGAALPRPPGSARARGAAKNDVVSCTGTAGGSVSAAP